MSENILKANLKMFRKCGGGEGKEQGLILN
jgi:hypothetical protein